MSGRATMCFLYSGILLERVSTPLNMEGFDCGDEDLNDYFRNDSAAYQRPSSLDTASVPSPSDSSIIPPMAIAACWHSSSSSEAFDVSFDSINLNISACASSMVCINSAHCCLLCFLIVFYFYSGYYSWHGFAMPHLSCGIKRYNIHIPAYAACTAVWLQILPFHDDLCVI